MFLFKLKPEGLLYVYIRVWFVENILIKPSLKNLKIMWYLNYRLSFDLLNFLIYQTKRLIATLDNHVPTALFCMPISLFSDRLRELYSYKAVPEVYLLMLGSRQASIKTSFNRLLGPVSGPWRALLCVSTIPEIKTSWY